MEVLENIWSLKYDPNHLFIALQKKNLLFEENILLILRLSANKLDSPWMSQDIYYLEAVAKWDGKKKKRIFTGVRDQ